MLTFVFVGANPTGVEPAAELNDMVQGDISRLYPTHLLDNVRIQIIDLQEFILSTTTVASPSTPRSTSAARESRCC